jgi:AcrR family transcriptional regulator
MGREQIAVSALRLLNADPTASMAAIAAAAGVSRATLHRNYASREDLIRHLGELSLTSWREALDEAGIDAAVHSADPEQLSRALEAMCCQLIRDADEYGFTFTENTLRNDDDIVAASEVLANRELAFYSAAQRAGVLRSDLPAAWIGHAVFGLLVGLRDALRRGDIAVRDAQRLFRGTLLHGISAP